MQIYGALSMHSFYLILAPKIPDTVFISPTSDLCLLDSVSTPSFALIYSCYNMVQKVPSRRVQAGAIIVLTSFVSLLQESQSYTLVSSYVGLKWEGKFRTNFSCMAKAEILSTCHHFLNVHRVMQHKCMMISYYAKIIILY